MCLPLIVVFLTLVLCITFAKKVPSVIAVLWFHTAEEREEPYVYILGRGTLPPPLPPFPYWQAQFVLAADKAKFSPADVKYVI